SHGVLDQRLQQQRRNEAGLSVGFHVLLDGETFSEPETLDLEVRLRQRELFFDRNALSFPQRQTLSQELRKVKTHCASSDRVGPGESGDRVQAVEQKVRVDPGLQRFELRLPGE